MKTTLILMIALFLSCKKEIPLPNAYNALVIGYDSRKCYGLYGWKFVSNGDTLLTASPVMGAAVGYKTEYPVKVNICYAEYDSLYVDVIYVTVVNK